MSYLNLLFSSLIFLVVSTAVAIRRDKSILYSRTSINCLIFSGIIIYNLIDINTLDNGIGVYGGLFNVTTTSQTFNLFVFLISAIILIFTSFFPRKVYTTQYESLYKLISFKFLYNKKLISNLYGEQFRIIEYPLIILFIISGAVFLISTGDLISIFLSIELQSYGLYIICTLYRDSESATGSGLTYFLLGGLSSCFILLGSALLYINAGTTNMDNIYIITSISELHYYSFSLYQSHYLNLALIIMLVGFLFKVSAAPFHFWSPDVYDGIPTVVTTYVAIIAKLSIFAFLLEIVYYTESNSLDFSWKNILIISSILSLFIGSVLGLTQFRIKRLYAYSTISHVGFILLALSINSVESIQSFIFYLLQYTISNLNAFFLLLSIGYSLFLYVNKQNKESMVDQNKQYNESMIDGDDNNRWAKVIEGRENKERESFINKNNSPIQLINQVKGYFYVNSFISVSFAITVFSFIGIPPMIGFFAKQMILSAALDNGYVFMSLVAILTSVIGAGYYLNLIKEIFFYKSNYKKNTSTENITLLGHVFNNNYDQRFKSSIEFKSENIKLNSAITTVISIITLLISLFIFMPEEWYNIIAILTLTQFKA